jgi:GGDEF domain-containing protein
MKDLLKLLSEGKGEVSLVDYIKTNRTPPLVISPDMNIFDAYNYLRKYRANYALVTEQNKVIGEVCFKTLTWQIIDILIKDPLTGVYNYHYFNILIERYKDINKPMGIILIEIENLEIIERFQSATLVNKILKSVANILIHSVRDIDFIFRIDNRFTVMLFQPLEVTKKVEERLRERLKNLEVDGVAVRFKIAYSHIPELKETILMAIDDCERKILKQSEYQLL